jgi:predicted GNAT superfamily acetyltransferase
MSKYLTKAIHQRAYAQAYARHVDSVRRGLAHDRLESMWPSTEKVEGGRQHVSPLGGVALPQGQKGRS